MTRVTSKYQTTIPVGVRRILHVKPGDDIEWRTTKTMVVVDLKPKINDPVKVLSSLVKRPITVDAVKLVKKAREEMW